MESDGPRINAVRILRDHFSPFCLDGVRRLNKSRVLWFIVVPVAVGSVVTWRLGRAPDVLQAVFLTVFTISAGVLTALLPVVQSMVTQTEMSEYAPSQLLKHQRRMLRLRTLRDLYANIIYTVTLNILGLLPVLGLTITNPQFAASQPVITVMERVFACFLTWCIYFVFSSLAIALFYIVSGIYLVLDVQAEEITTSSARKFHPLGPAEREHDDDGNSSTGEG